MTPSVGHIVHYVSYGTPGGEYTSQCRAAIVTETDTSDTVGLCVLNPTGQFFNRTITHDEDEKRGGTWHWPERTPTRAHPIVVNIQVTSDENHADIGRQVVEAIREYEGRGGNPPAPQPA